MPPSPTSAFAKASADMRGGGRLHRRALRLRPAQMLVQPRHDLDEIAGTRAVVELGNEDAVPAVAAGAGRAGKTEDVGRARNPRSDTALDRRRADLGVAQHVERDRKAVHALLEQRLDRLRRDVAPGEAGAAGGDDDIDAGIRDPAADRAADRLDIVGDELARGEMVPGRD